MLGFFRRLKRPFVSDITPTEFDRNWRLFVELARVARDDVDLAAKRYLFDLITEKGCPDSASYYDLPEPEVLEADPSSLQLEAPPTEREEWLVVRERGRERLVPRFPLPQRGE